MKLKKFLSVILAVVMIAGSMSFTAFADSWDGTPDTAWYTGDSDVYVIGTPAELAGLAQLVNDGTLSAGVNIELGADIDLEQVDWTSIGTSSNPFVGTFDGKGYTISNLWCYERGLFGYTSTGNYGDNTGIRATITNLILNNAEVYSQGTRAVGAVVGQAQMNTVVTNVKLTGTIKVYGYGYVGGIVGQGYTQIDNCHVEGITAVSDEINAAYWAVGGIIGHAGSEGGSSITNCSVKNVKIYSENYGAGSIAGVGTTGTIENISAENTVVEAGSEPDANGYLLGCDYGELTGTNTATNVGLVVDGVVQQPTENFVAQVNGTNCMTLDSAIEIAESGSEIILISDVTLDEVVNISKSLILNLNGKTITVADSVKNSRAIILNDECTEFTVNANGGKIVSAADSSKGILDVDTVTDVTINGGTYDYDTDAGGLFKFRWPGTTVTLNNVNVETNYQISGPDNAGEVLDVNGGTFKSVNTYNGSNYFAFYIANGATATFDGVTIENEYVGAVESYNADATLTDCDITVKGINKAVYQTVAASVSNGGNLTINSGSYKTEPLAASDADGTADSHGSWTLIIMNSGGTMTINDGTFSNGNYGDDADASNPREIISFGAKDADDAATLIINGGTFNSIGAAIYRESGSGKYNATITDGIFNYNTSKNVFTDKYLPTDTFEITGGKFVTDPSEYVAEDYKAYSNLSGYYTVDKSALDPSAIEVDFAEVTENVPEGEKLYNINLVAANEDIINRLNSADLTFEFTSEAVNGGAMNYTIEKVDNIAVTTDSDYTDRYMFSFEHKDNVTDTANAITIAQVRFTGYGDFEFAVKDLTAAEKDTNIVNATKVTDNIVNTFVVGGTLVGDATVGNLVITDKVDATIAVPTRALTIDVTFPNVVTDQAKAYQAMTVTISGGDLAADITANLGTDEKAMADGKYTVTANLTKNIAYNITVKGAGYRTARYTVTMTENKTVTFWNNVMDDNNAMEVAESGAENGEAKLNFLAGDIVADNNINVYDLSAVVSYFATTNDTSAYSDYAKYDLNRDGVIDSKDVAYVLVSWNN